MKFNGRFRYNVLNDILDEGLKFLSAGDKCDLWKELGPIYSLQICSYKLGTKENASTCSNIVLSFWNDGECQPLYDVDIFNGHVNIDFYDSDNTTIEIDFNTYTNEPELTEEMFFQMQCVMDLDCISYEELKKMYEIGHKIERI